jgi:hypothetical protein
MSSSKQSGNVCHLRQHLEQARSWPRVAGFTCHDSNLPKLVLRLFWLVAERFRFYAKTARPLGTALRSGATECWGQVIFRIVLVIKYNCHIVIIVSINYYHYYYYYYYWYHHHHHHSPNASQFII